MDENLNRLLGWGRSGQWDLVGSTCFWGLLSWLLPFLFLPCSDSCLLWREQLHHTLSMVSWDNKNHRVIIPNSCCLKCLGHTGDSAAHCLCAARTEPHQFSTCWLIILLTSVLKSHINSDNRSQDLFMASGHQSVIGDPSLQQLCNRSCLLIILGCFT